MVGLDERPLEDDDGTDRAAPVWAVFGDLMAGLVGAFVLILVGVLVVQMDLVASLQAEVQKRHDNPRSGETCPVDKLGWPVDLAHIFETDLRAIRFSTPLPDFGRKKESETREAREGFVRTLSEALRLAATG